MMLDSHGRPHLLRPGHRLPGRRAWCAARAGAFGPWRYADARGRRRRGAGRRSSTRTPSPDGWAARAWKRWRSRGWHIIAASTGDIGEVLPLVDEAASLAMRPGVAPVDAGYVYCAVISVCRALCDWGRATEWTKVSTRYCERESIAGYTGLCRFHQGEINRLHGQLAEAEQRVLQACEELLGINRYSAGWGFSELVEIRVRRGDLDGAEEALAEAVALGDDGQPGRGRLLLAQGDARAAVRSLSRSLEDPGFLARERRIFLLPVYVAACIAAGDEQAATESVVELEEVARKLGTPGPAAAAAVRTRAPCASSRRHQGGDRLAAEGGPHVERGRGPVRGRSGARPARAGPDRRRRRHGRPPRAQGRRAAGRRVRRRRRSRHRARPGRRVSNHPHVPVLRHRRLDTTVRGHRRRCVEPLLQWHDRTLRAEFERWNGEEIKHGGDGFFVAFGDADDGIACAAAIQRALRHVTVPSTASRRASASGSTRAKRPRARGTTSDRRSRGPHASPRLPVRARCWRVPTSSPAAGAKCAAQVSAPWSPQGHRRARRRRSRRLGRGSGGLGTLEPVARVPFARWSRFRTRTTWWALRDSNPRPPPCKGGALAS